jgi:hypothetical protein
MLHAAHANVGTQPVAGPNAWRTQRSVQSVSKGWKPVDPFPVVELNPKLLKQIWSGWMDQCIDFWRVASIQSSRQDGCISGVQDLQTQRTQKPKCTQGNIIRHDDDVHVQFSLYLRADELTMEDLEANFASHPYVKRSTLEWNNSKLMHSAPQHHEGAWNVRFQTWDDHSIVAGLTRHKEGKDDCGIQISRAFVRFDQRCVLYANHGRVCDMLLNTCGYFSWFEMGQVRRKVNSQPVVPPPPSSGSLWRHLFQAMAACGCWGRCEALLAACGGASKWFCMQPVAHP